MCRGRLSGHILFNNLPYFTYNIMTSGIIFFLGLIPLTFIIAFSELGLGIAFIQAQVLVVLSSGGYALKGWSLLRLIQTIFFSSLRLLRRFVVWSNNCFFSPTSFCSSVFGGLRRKIWFRPSLFVYIYMFHPNIFFFFTKILLFLILRIDYFILEDSFIFTWDGYNNSSAGQGSNSSGGNPGGGGNGPPPGGPNPTPWNYLPGERKNDVDGAFDDLKEMAERRTINAIKNGTIKPENKQDFYIGQLRGILQMHVRELAVDTPGKSVSEVENYNLLRNKMEILIKKLRKNS